MANATQWLNRLKESEKHEENYRKRAQKVIDTYRDERTQRNRKGNGTQPTVLNGTNVPKMALLWANTETMRPALYSSTPMPVAKRRYSQEDPIARTGSEVLEKLLEHAIDNGLLDSDFDHFADEIISDYLLPGRSVDRVMLDDVDVEGLGTVARGIRWHHVPWLWFRYQPQARWKDVDWVAFGDHFFQPDELKDRFELTPRQMEKITTKQKNIDTDDVEDLQVWELWCKSENTVKWLMEGVDFFLDETEPPVELSGFFDIPKPLYSIETNDSLIPIPEYTQYQYQAEEVNHLTRRIHRVTKAIRANGVYAGHAASELANILNSDDGKMHPIDDYAMWIEKGGISGLMDFAPIEEYAKVLQILTLQRQQLIQQIFDITGISDLQRGASDPRETARAQQIKAMFGNRRIQPRQLQVQRYIRDLLRIAAETMAEGYDGDMIDDIVGAQVPDEVLQVLRDDLSRTYNIDVETDSTIAPDEQQEKQAVTEFMGAMAQFLPVAVQIGQVAGPQLAGEIIKWAMRRFRAGREVEQALEDAIAQAEQQPQQQQPQDPEKQAKAMAIINKAQLEAQDMAADNQREDLETQVDIGATVADIRRKDEESDARIRKIEAQIAEIRRKDDAA